MSLRVLVVDDEPPARERLHDLVTGLGHQVCGQAADGVSALHEAERLLPDVVLLDIRMPGQDGLSTARRLNEQATPPAVIFTTAYDDHALEAFEARAIAYLLKPIRREALARALEHARVPTRAQLAGLGPNAAPNPVCVRLGNRLQRIPFGDIYYFQADQKYVTIRHRQGEAVTEQPLKSLETEYGDRVLRIHRNALVSVEHLHSLVRTDDEKHLLVFDGIPDQLEVSRRHLAAVRKRLRAD